MVLDRPSTRHRFQHPIRSTFKPQRKPPFRSVRHRIQIMKLPLGLLSCLSPFVVTVVSADPPSFPGAQGYGSVAIGGRGGTTA